MKKLYSMLCGVRLWAALLLVAAGSSPVLAQTVENLEYEFSFIAKTATIKKYDSGLSGDLVIPSSITYAGEDYAVTAIAEGAFKNVTSITSVTIPNSVTTVGNNAFNGCNAITKVTIEDGETTLSFGADIFSISLESVYLGRNITYSASPFTNQTKLESVTISESVTEIGSSAFYGCSSLTSVTIPASVTRIGNYAFNDCKAIKEVILEDGDETLKVGNFDNFLKLGLFLDCRLEKLYLGRILSYSISPFRNQTILTELTIGNSVTSIRSSDFEGCSALTSITLSESITEIGDQAFSETKSLESITCYSENPPVLGSGVFSSADLSKCELHVPKGSEKRYMFSDIWKEMKLVPASLFIHNLEETIVLGIGARTQLQASVFGSYKFSHKIIWKSDNPSVATVDENGCVIAIAKGSAKISATSESDPELTDICIVNVVEEYPYVLSGHYDAELNGFKIDYFQADNLVDVVIPETMLDTESGLYYNTVAIGFIGSSNIRSLVIPKTVEVIQPFALWDLENLETVWYDATSVKPNLYQERIEHRYPLDGSTWQTWETQDKLKGNGMFWRCPKLKNVYIGNEVKTIPHYTFANTNIETIVIPDNVESIGVYCFQNCNKLTDIKIGTGLTAIGTGAFARESGSETTLFFDAISIEQYGSNNDDLYDAKINKTTPFGNNTITTLLIGDNAGVFNTKVFNDLDAIKDIYCYSSQPIFLSDGFKTNNRRKCTVHVPAVSEPTYKSHSYWKDFFYYGYEMHLDAENLTIAQDEKHLLNVISIPQATHELAWSSDNPEIATVNNDGLVTGISDGVTKITVQSIYDPTLTATCVVTVSASKPYTLEVSYVASRGGCVVTGFTAGNPVDVIIPTRWYNPNTDAYYDIVGIDEAAFKGSDKVKSIVIPENLRNISPGAFAGCSELQTIWYNAIGLTTSSDANPNHNTSPIFENCPKLKDIYVGKNVQSLPAYIFKSTDPENLVIPNVISFGTDCFDGWTKLMEIHCDLATPPALQDDIFSAVDKTGCTLRVPDGFTNAYANAYVWKDFLTILGHNEVPVTSLTLNLESTEIEDGGSVQLTAIVTPDDATDKSITWSSSDESIATVDADGKVTGVTAGVATITATTAKGLTATCEVTVKTKATDPDKPTNPEQPTDPENPTDPEQPTDPENPTDPDQPTDPENPDDETDAIEGITGDGEVCVSVEGGAIIVTAPEGAVIEVYGITGALVRSTREHRIEGLTRGVYLIRIGSRSFKVAL